MANSFSLAALVGVVIVSVAFAQPIEASKLSSAQIAERLNESGLSAVDTLDLLERQDPEAVEAIFRDYDASNFSSFTEFEPHDCGFGLVGERTKFYRTFKTFKDDSQIFANLNRFCSVTLKFMKKTCDEFGRPSRLNAALDAEAMRFRAQIERYLANHRIEASKLISDEAGDVLECMYPKGALGSAAKRDYCLKLIKQVDSLSDSMNVPSPRYHLAYQACQKWRAVQWALISAKSD